MDALCDSRNIRNCLAGSLHDYVKSFLQPSDTNTLKGRGATLKLLQNREIWYQSGILTPSIPNASGTALGKWLFPFVNTCLKVLGIKEIIRGSSSGW